MYRLVVVYLSSVSALTDVDKKCIKDNSELLSNDILLGSWYRVYRFAPGGRLVPSCTCTEVTYSKPSVQDIIEYKNKYNASDVPYSLDDNPVLQKDNLWDGMLMGLQRAKFFVLTPNTTARLLNDFTLTAFKPLTDKYLLATECAMRGNVRWLYSRDKDSTVEDMDDIIKKTPEFNNLGGWRMCAICNYRH